MSNKLQKGLVTGLDMQQSQHLGCDWTDDRLMFLHQGNDMLINPRDVVENIPNLKTISHMQIPSHCIATNTG